MLNQLNYLHRCFDQFKGQEVRMNGQVIVRNSTITE